MPAQPLHTCSEPLTRYALGWWALVVALRMPQDRTTRETPQRISFLGMSLLANPKEIMVSFPFGSRLRCDIGGVLQYDKGKRGPGGFKIESHINSPPDLLISAIDKLSQDYRFKRGKMAEYIEEAQSKLEAMGMSHFSFPGRHHDILFRAEYNHPNENEDHCQSCDSAQIIRTLASRNDPVVHHGLIASGNTDCRDAHMRATMRRDHEAICFETEEATLMNNFPCLAIRGISDYADSHKNDLWQPYAALTAAAYAKDLLGLMEPQEIVGAGMILNEGMSNPRLLGGGPREDRMLEYQLSDGSNVLGGYANVAREVQ
ncbi:nucleoside phosphorylase domain-containing protein [Aspergillus pseudodeflectus]|uniref:Nucleoside phosphorylase domain-containing protein n=1 Tax=Aspergillus pseudodeflectus TaxID=176178 RepID=A0ABR4K3K2_9EURO